MLAKLRFLRCLANQNNQEEMCGSISWFLQG